MGGQIQNKPIETVEGEFFELVLPSNPSTGTLWKIKEFDNTLLSFIKNEFIETHPESEGSPGTEVYTFKALKKGNTTIRMTHERFGQENGLVEYFKVIIN